MPAPRLVAFDLDDTLAPSKSPIDPRIGDLLIALAERVEVAIISGGQLQQFQTQVVERLPQADDAIRARFHLMPTCGTQYYRLRHDGVDRDRQSRVERGFQDVGPQEGRLALLEVAQR